MTRGVPLPPLELAARVGATHADRWARYEEVGALMKEEILRLLPEGWTFEGKRILDFGCGAGRTLRHFLAEAEACELYGCDIDRESIAWLEENLSPPLRVFACDEVPPLPLEPGSLDLVWAISVFTHLSDLWAHWLLELHRLLRPGGLLIATFMGRGLSLSIADEPWVEDRIGMNVVHQGQPWDQGGPMVLHSPWWLREHWGRAFEVLSLREDGFVPSSGTDGQGIVLLRKTVLAPTVAELERIDPAEPRELAALRHNVRQLHEAARRARSLESPT